MMNMGVAIWGETRLNEGMILSETSGQVEEEGEEGR